MMIRRVCLILGLSLFLLWPQENGTSSTIEQLESKLKSANERIAQLEERIKLMTLQQQGAVQFFQAGQALCELDKKQPQPSKTEKP